jgi:hypothetical protein
MNSPNYSELKPLGNSTMEWPAVGSGQPFPVRFHLIYPAFFPCIWGVGSQPERWGYEGNIILYMYIIIIYIYIMII